MTKRIALIDGDTIAFKAACGKNEDGTERSFDEVMQCVESRIEWIKSFLHADDIQVILTDPDINFRHGCYPPYKSQRDQAARPQIINDAKDYMRLAYGAFHYPTLEADDVQGIIATLPHSDEIEYIVVSIDKDLRQIPGLLFNPDKWTLGIQVIEPDDGMLWKWTQALTGDTGDGYPGIPGVGPARVTKLLGEAVASGIEVQDLWPTVLAYFKEKGHTEEFALGQLRCAHILQAGDYNITSGTVNLLTPKVAPQEQ